ncbi:MAG: hypothetical protein CL693_19865 [Cellvibrionaceae bacterium]|nr:hypothetical protein [Cellvibrionaceae bacterium]|tara:strand:- start:13714 stop:14097 length:384 start_codon:yes stop_codon:yes gene_type:complete
MKKITTAIAVLTLVGCAGSPWSIQSMTAEELRIVPDSQLAQSFTHSRTQLVEAELRRRGLINADNEAHIRNETIAVGLDLKSAALALGPPMRVNESVGRSGKQTQWVYPGNRYVYLENGVVTSWSGW